MPAAPPGRPKAAAVSPGSDESDDADADEAPAAALPADAESVWTQVLQKAREKNGYFYVQAGQGRLASLSAGEAVIVIPANRPSARAELNTPERRKDLQALFQDVLGRPVQVRVEGETEAAPADGGPRPTVRRTPAHPGAPLESPPDDPMIRETLAKFGGRIVSTE